MLLRAPHYTHLNELPVGAIHSLLERLGLLPGSPAKGKGNGPTLDARLLEPVRNRFGIGELSIEKSYQELVTAHSYDRLLGAHMPHQEPAHLDEDRVTSRMAVRVVVLLEVIDVHVDAAPSVFIRPLRRKQRREISAVVAAGEGIANALLHQLRFEILPRRDVDENPVKDRLAGVGVPVEVPRVEHGAHSPVRTRYLELTVAGGSFPLHQLYLLTPDFRIHEIADLVLLQIIQAVHAKDSKERWIRVENLSFLVGYVDAFAEVLDEPFECLWIAEAGEPRTCAVSGHARFFFVQANDPSMCGMSIAPYTFNGGLSMTRKDAKEQMDTEERDPVERSGDTHSGTPNAVDPNQERSTEHQSGYGGKGGKPRTSSDERQNLDK